MKETLENDLAQTDIDIAITAGQARQCARISREQALVRSPLDGVVVQIYTRQGERVSPTGIVKIVDMSQLRVLADVDELHLGRVAPGGKVEVTFRGSTDGLQRHDLAHRAHGEAHAAHRARRRLVDRRPRRAGRDRARRPVQHAAGAGPRDARHLPLMALTLPAAAHRRGRAVVVAAASRWPRLRAAAKTAAAMPLGAQQLRRQRTSTLLSLAGVTASLLVIFAQLGIERAVYEFGGPPPSRGGRPTSCSCRPASSRCSCMPRCRSP